MKPKPSHDLEICILAGGLSRRMARDKSRLRLGRRTMLGHVRAAAESLGLPVRVIRRDLVPRCGPLGGIVTALKSSRAEIVLFLACDMPFIRPGLLGVVLRRFGFARDALFTRSKDGAGFPFVLRRAVLDRVSAQIARGEVSLRDLARALKAGAFRPPYRYRLQLRNLNTPDEWDRARRVWPESF